MFRGLTVVGMVFVNNPGDWGHLYWPFDHAEWHGWTPTDLIFPWFLFIVGVAGVFSLEKRMAQGADRLDLARHAFRRGMTIVLVGWLMAFYPFVPFLERLVAPTHPRRPPAHRAHVRPRDVDPPRRLEAARRRRRGRGRRPPRRRTRAPPRDGLRPDAGRERPARRGPRRPQGPSLEERAGLGPGGARLDAHGDRDDAHGYADGLPAQERGRREGEGRAAPRRGELSRPQPASSGAASCRSTRTSGRPPTSSSRPARRSWRSASASS